MPAKRFAVIGSGPMGLACAYELLKHGHHVEVFERDNRMGGMSASFDLDGLIIERFYHFICATDDALFELLAELDISGQLRWKKTGMGHYCDGHSYPWCNPFDLLAFPKLTLMSKLRYAMHILYCKKFAGSPKLDQLKAVPWLRFWVGDQAYQLLWDRLLTLKFQELKHEVSAAWIATRIQRLAKSRSNVFYEKLGYLEGGSNTFLKAIGNRIEALGGVIHLSAPVERIVFHHNQARSLMVGGVEKKYDCVISTIPLPYLPGLFPDMPEEILHKIQNLKNIGVVCVVFRLKRSISEYFWLNITDKRIAIPGIIEYTRLNAMIDGSIVYAPYYIASTHPKYKNSDQTFIEETMCYLHLLNNELTDDWIEAVHVSRYHCAQPICTPGFLQQLPPTDSGIGGFYMADTSYYYPEDRSISESVKLGRTLARQASGAQGAI